MIGISGSLIWSKTLLQLIFNPCGKISVKSGGGPVSQIHSPHLHVGAPGIVSDLVRSVQMLKREWGSESNGMLQHLFNPYREFIVLKRVAIMLSRGSGVRLKRL